MRDYTQNAMQFCLFARKICNPFAKYLYINDKDGWASYKLEEIANQSFSDNFFSAVVV